ncbi:MAG TPA: hypothetical protein VMX75_10960 [Spirochaetia bacterium]|nr:hypothetical protein [Spirochaetia bacterium]
MVVDAHIHIGGSRISANDFTETELIGEMDRGGIDAAIVQPFPYPNPEAQRLHDTIAELAVSSRARPGFF